MVITGIAEFPDGTVAERVRVLASGSYAWVADVVPDPDHTYTVTVPDAGTYYVWIEAVGQVTLALGPTYAVDP